MIDDSDEFPSVINIADIPCMENCVQIGYLRIAIDTLAQKVIVAVTEGLNGEIVQAAALLEPRQIDELCIALQVQKKHFITRDDLPQDIVTFNLSRRETQVMMCIARGQPPASIAEDLGLSPKTVSTYRARIFEKTGMRSNAEIVGYCIRRGLMS